MSIDGGSLKESFDHIRTRLVKLETLETALPLLTVRLTNSINQTIPNNLLTLVDFDTIVYETIPDLVQLFDNTITVPTDGIYRIQAKVTFSSAGSGSRLLNIAVNGEFIDETEGRNSVAGLPTQLDLVIETNLEAGDIITAQVSQDSGSPLDLITSVSNPLLSISQIHL